MDITVERKTYTNNSTIGRLSVDGEEVCYTLEDRVRAEGVKIFGATAIPAGVYNVVIDMSAHFGKIMPHILDVEGFDGVRIHPGNTPANTEGCLLVGETDGDDFIGQSREAFGDLFHSIDSAIANGEVVTLTINDNVPEGWVL